MANRPGNITLPSRPGTAATMTTMGSGQSSPGRLTPGSGMPSPRIARAAGELTPAMSPLDMFAAQSRALARQLDESKRTDRRVSRLPPLTVADGLGRRTGGGMHSASPSSAESQGRAFGGPFSARHAASGASLSAGPSSAGPGGYGGLWSAGAAGSPPFSPPSEESGIKLAIESPHSRPKSHYPRFSKFVEAMDDGDGQPMAASISMAGGASSASSTSLATGTAPASITGGDAFLTPSEYHQNAGPADYFNAPRTRSPDQASQTRPSLESTSQKSSFSSISRPKHSLESTRRNLDLARGLSIESTSSRASQYSHGLHPPNPPYARKTPSIRSVSSEDDNPGITPSSSYSHHRKLSSSSGTSLPLSPPGFQYAQPHNRSASQLSEYSTNRLSRPAFNFSRPLSRNSGVPTELSPTRMSSIDSYTRDSTSMDSHTRIYRDEEIPPVMSMESSGIVGEPEDGAVFGQKGEETAGQNSYIYAKYSLPRGRMVDRNSLPLEALMPKIDFDSSAEASEASHARQEAYAPPPSMAHLVERQPRNSSESLPTARQLPPTHDLRDQHRHSMTSMYTSNTANTGNSGSTIKASKQNPGGGAAVAAASMSDRSTASERSKKGADMSAEEHLQKGIDLHERGSLQEATYHLRLAARAGNPTGMLLFALACRHGWGMRQSPSEGIHWLRKAIDCANIEMNESEHAAGAQADAQKQKRAQFSLGVYELGVSHMNGWGVEHDKALALRCFEIAAAWGDADAMAEAGFCYYQGTGCKKDLKKAAKYYRQAEKRGMSMVGNSWIHKSKYDEKPENKEDDRAGRSRAADGADEKKDKKREKSRTRSLFSRKRSDR